MRNPRYFAPASVLTLLLCGSVALAQDRPRHGGSLHHPGKSSQFAPTATAPGNGNFTLTILGANFQSNSVVNLSFPAARLFLPQAPPQMQAVRKSSPSFTNAILPTPATLLVTVTNPKWHASTTSNALLFARTPAQHSRSIESEHHIFFSERPDRDCCGEFTGSGLPDSPSCHQNTNTVHCGMERF